MSFQFQSPRAFRCFACCLVSGALLLALAGCSEDDPIDTYVVAKEPTPGAVWFFKLLGPEAAVSEAADELRKFAASVRFDEKSGTPEWTLPEDWVEKPSQSAFRYRTIEIPGTPPLEIAVSHVAGKVPLPKPELESHANLLREQVQESESDDAGKPAVQPESFAAGKLSGHLFDFSGETTRFGKTRLLAAMIPTPFSPQAASSASAAPQREVPFTYKTPEGWEEAPQTQFSVVSLSVSDGANSAAATVTPAFGDLLANVNRWRGQVGLDALGEDELAAAIEEIPVGDLKAQWTEAIGDDRGIIGAVIEGGGGQWFLKLDGHPEVVQSQREKFREFVQSVEFK